MVHGSRYNAQDETWELKVKDMGCAWLQDFKFWVPGLSEHKLEARNWSLRFSKYSAAFSELQCADERDIGQHEAPRRTRNLIQALYPKHNAHIPKPQNPILYPNPKL